MIIVCAVFASETLATECVGPRQAEYGAVYLHGTDRSYRKREELANRLRIESLAERFRLRIALPRATAPCGSMNCWGTRLTDGDYFALIRQIHAAIGKCEIPKRKMGLIGFSSGGYMVIELYQRGLFASRALPVSWAVAIGAGKNWRARPSQDGPAMHGKLTLMQGLFDPFEFDPSRELFEWMRKRSSKVRLVEFPGGHEIPDGFEGEIMRLIYL